MKQEIKYLGIIGVVIMVVALILVANNLEKKNPKIISSGDELKKFTSLEDLKSYISESESYSNNGYARGGALMDAIETAESAALPAADSKSSDQSSSTDYSQTNIQVEGVDEPDIVKNDGKYIYAVSGNKVSIIEAFPADKMKVLKNLEFTDSINNIFLNDDKLIVFTNHYEYFEGGGCITPMYGAELSIRMPCYSGYSRVETKVTIYDVSSHEEPTEEKEFSVSGNYNDARMVGDYVYLISTKYISLNNFELPYYYDGTEKFVIEPTEIRYFDYSDNSYVINIFSAIDLENEEINTETYMLGSSQTTYVSENNIYLTMRKSLSQEQRIKNYVDEVLLEVLPDIEAEKIQGILDSNEKFYKKSRDISEAVQEYIDSLEGTELQEFVTKFSEKNDAYYKKLSEELDKSVIHKINFEKTEFNYEGKGEIPGSVLNQFSMDERGDYFRIATTKGQTWNGESTNNLYVLDEDLDIVGEVEGLAEGERIYSTRFLGNRAYMVTFKQVDPLFVIDLTDEENPEVLGYLKVTGYSSYLHPYDETHLIGVGMEATTEGRVQGVKVALFDVSDVANPEEIGKYEIDDGRWSSTDVLYDHKAFLFDKEKGIIVMPVSYSDYNNYWQGAYVLKINLEEGIRFKGKIAHEIESSGEYYGYGPQTDYVRRALYMDDVLYTISNTKVKASALTDLSEIKEVNLPSFDQVYYGRGGIAVAASGGAAVE